MSESDTVIPLFPLHTLLYPGGLLPLRIFEPRYLDMVSRCMREESGFGVVALTGGSDTGAPAQFVDIGTLATIINFDQGEDGLLAIMGLGQRRFTVLETELAADNLVTATVSWRDEGEAAAVPDELGHLPALLKSVLEGRPHPFGQLETQLGDAAWVSYRLAELLPLEGTDKLRLLAIDDPLERLKALDGLVAAMRS